MKNSLDQTSGKSSNWFQRGLRAIFIDRRLPTFVEKRIDALMTGLGVPTKTVKIGDFRVKIRRQNADFGFAKSIIENNEYQVDGFDVEANDTVIDIGANIGSFALYASKKANNGKVFSLEPFPDSFQLLEDNLRINQIKNVIPLELAVAEKSGPIDFHVAELSGSHSLAEEFHQRSTVNSLGKVTVNATTLQDVMTTQNIEFCDFLKIDCEGAEYEILWSLPHEYFSKIRKIALEYHLVTPDERETKVQELKTFLEQFNFELISKRTAGPHAGLMYFTKKDK